MARGALAGCAAPPCAYPRPGWAAPARPGPAAASSVP